MPDPFVRRVFRPSLLTIVLLSVGCSEASSLTASGCLAPPAVLCCPTPSYYSSSLHLSYLVEDILA